MRAHTHTHVCVWDDLCECGATNSSSRACNACMLAHECAKAGSYVRTHTWTCTCAGELCTDRYLDAHTRTCAGELCYEENSAGVLLSRCIGPGELRWVRPRGRRTYIHM